MQIERTDKEILIRLFPETDLAGLQRILDYLLNFMRLHPKVKPLTKKSTSSQQLPIQRGGQKIIVDLLNDHCC